MNRQSKQLRALLTFFSVSMIYDTTSDHWLNRIYMANWHEFFLLRFRTRFTVILNSRRGQMNYNDPQASKEIDQIHELRNDIRKHVARYLNEVQAEDWCEKFIQVRMGVHRHRVSNHSSCR